MKLTVSQRRIMEAIAAEPAAPLKIIARRLSLTPQCIRVHLSHIRTSNSLGRAHRSNLLSAFTNSLNSVTAYACRQQSTRSWHMAAGAISALEGVVIADMQGAMSSLFSVLNTFTNCRFAFEWRMADSDSWKPLWCVRTSNLKREWQTDLLSGDPGYGWMAQVGVVGQMRARCIQYGSGTATFYIFASAHPIVVVESDPKVVSEAVDIADRAQQSLALSTSATQTTDPITEDGIYDVWCDEGAAWIKHAVSANDVTAASGYKLQPGNTVQYRLYAGKRLGAIMASGTGTLRWHRSQ